MKLLGILSALTGLILLFVNWIFLGSAILAAGLWIAGLIKVNGRGIGSMLIIGSLAYGIHHSFTYLVVSILLLGIFLVACSFFNEPDLIADMTNPDNYFDGDSD